MTSRSWVLAGAAAAAALVGACSTNGDDAPADGTASGAGASAGSGTGTSGSGSGGIPALVNVNLENVLNNLSVDLKVDRANIPVNAQVPIDVAANVCGTSVSVLGASTGG